MYPRAQASAGRIEELLAERPRSATRRTRSVSPPRAARSRCAASRTPTPEPRGPRSRASASKSRPAACWASSARPARARPRCSLCLGRLLEPEGLLEFDGIDVKRIQVGELRARAGLRAAGQLPLLRALPRQHRLRLRQRRSPTRASAELIELACMREEVAHFPQGVEHAGRRARRDALGRPAPAHLHRARAGARAARPDPRRRALGGRHRDRGAAAREPAPRRAGPHRGRRRAPALLGRARRAHPGARHATAASRRRARTPSCSRARAGTRETWQRQQAQRELSVL